MAFLHNFNTTYKYNHDELQHELTTETKIPAQRSTIDRHGPDKLKGLFDTLGVKYELNHDSTNYIITISHEGKYFLGDDIEECKKNNISALEEKIKRYYDLLRKHSRALSRPEDYFHDEIEIDLD